MWNNNFSAVLCFETFIAFCKKGRCPWRNELCSRSPSRRHMKSTAIFFVWKQLVKASIII